MVALASMEGKGVEKISSVLWGGEERTGMLVCDCACMHESIYVPVLGVVEVEAASPVLLRDEDLASRLRRIGIRVGQQVGRSVGR